MKKIFSLYLSFLIALSPIILMNQANATLVNGWDLRNPIADGARTVYEATKNVIINGKNVVKTSSIAIAPTAAEVAKVLARGGATLALSVAVEQLLGAVDWVLDPANNQIKYYKPADSDTADMSKAWKAINGSTSLYFRTASAACASRASYLGYSLTSTSISGDWATCTMKNASGGTVTTQVNYTSNPTYNPNAEKELKTLPLSTVAAQVISNAEGNTDKKAGAQVATMAAAADIVNEAESDNSKALPISTALDANAVTPTSETATGEATQTDQTTGETKTTEMTFEWVAACEWAPSFCEAAQTVISFPTTLTNWWETAITAVSTAYAETKEWFQSDESLPESETVDIDALPTPEIEENAISWGAQCPNDVDIPINLQGVSSTITFSWSPWCQLLSMIKPAIIASAYIGAAFIVLGLRT